MPALHGTRVHPALSEGAMVRFKEEKFIEVALAHGFDESQARFMWMYLFCDKEEFADALLSEEARDGR